MRRRQWLLTVAVLAVAVTAIALWRPWAAPGLSDSAGTPGGSLAAPTEFFNSCSGDVISVGFPVEYLAAGPGGGSSNFGLNSATGGSAKVEHWGTRRSTPVEAEAMMRKLYAGLRRTAQEKDCQVEGPPEISSEQAKAGFTLKYSKQNNTGEVVVTRIERTEKEYQDKDGKAVYTIRVVVSETVGNPPG